MHRVPACPWWLADVLQWIRWLIWASPSLTKITEFSQEPSLNLFDHFSSVVCILSTALEKRCFSSRALCCLGLTLLLHLFPRGGRGKSCIVLDQSQSQAAQAHLGWLCGWTSSTQRYWAPSPVRFSALFSLFIIHPLPSLLALLFLYHQSSLLYSFSLHAISPHHPLSPYPPQPGKTCFIRSANGPAPLRTWATWQSPRVHVPKLCYFNSLSSRTKVPQLCGLFFSVSVFIVAGNEKRSSHAQTKKRSRFSPVL